MITREARYLSGNDFGKTVTIETAGNLSGVLSGISAHGNDVSIYFENRKPVFAVHIYGSTMVKVTGAKETK